MCSDRLAFIGEKQSLADVLEPIAQQYRADLVLPTGELSTTLLYGIVKRAWNDGRPCRIFYFSDSDPTGFHMPIEVSRKLQALVDDRFPELDVQLRHCSLAAEQVQVLGLPSTPMKATERRADKWRERFGVEQTEIDALATLRPRDLRDIVEKAVAPYWDETLLARTLEARDDAQEMARAALAAIIEAKQDRLDAVEAVLAEARAANTMRKARAALALLPRCGAHARTTGQPCRGVAMKNGRCRMHGGKAGRKPTHGRYTRAAIADRRQIRAILRALRGLLG